MGSQAPGSRGESSEADVEAQAGHLCSTGSTAQVGVMSTSGNGGGWGTGESGELKPPGWNGGGWERREDLRHLLWGPAYRPLARPATLCTGPTQAWLPAPPQALLSLPSSTHWPRGLLVPSGPW